MSYIIGSADKTVLARRILHERNIPCFCAD
jgi:hypothetical protein